MDDLISRQAAIDALESIGSLDTEADKKYARSVFEALPSVQPKRTEERTETHSCDLIDRQAAIETVRKCAVKEVTPAYMLIDKAEAMTELMMLPSAQPEVRPIDYQDCSNAMLKMWMDNVVTDGEYNRIMDKLNAHWGKKDG